MFKRYWMLIGLLSLVIVIWIGCSDDSVTPAGGGTPDTEAPQISSMTVEDAAPQELVVTFDEIITAVSAAGFSATINSTGVVISGIDGSGTTSLRLTLPYPVLYPHTVTLQYDAASGSVQDEADPPNTLATFGATEVTNNIPNKIETIAGGNGSGYTGDDGPALSARFNEPWSVVCLGSTVYVADHMNTAIRKFTVDGNISTIEDHSYIGRPNDIWASGSWIYVAGNVHCVCRFQDGGSLERVGGAVYQPGFSGDGEPALIAKMMDPYGVWATGDDVYVADTYNDRIRAFTVGGNINTIAGDGSYYGDLGDGGPATGASLSHPYCIREYSGTFYVSTVRGRIRTFTEGGNIQSIVESGLNRPYGIDIFNGYIYIADSQNHAVKRVPIAGGTLETLAGGNGAGYSGDGSASTAALLNHPNGVHVECGYVYIADTYNHAIRRMHVPR
jgi:hypothetical protein